MTTINTKMADALRNHNNVHPPDRKAKAIYLGATEWEELRKYAKTECNFSIPKTLPNEGHRVEFCGVRCYKVDAEAHFGIA